MNYSYQKNIGNKDNRNLYANPVTKNSGFYDEAISLGTGIAHSRVVRVPKLKRKTAWKRFYRLFPHLKGMSVIPGSSCSIYHGLNASTIKLKKV